MKTSVPLEPLFYTYVIEDPRKPGPFRYGHFKFDYEPLYVGKGHKDRVFSHLVGNSHNVILKRKINKFRTFGLQPVVKMQSVRLTEKEAHDLEVKLISKIGRKDKKLGPLCNLTDGGEGVVGYTLTNEQKIIRTAALKATWKLNGDNIRKKRKDTIDSWSEEDKLEYSKRLSEGVLKANSKLNEQDFILRGKKISASRNLVSAEQREKNRKNYSNAAKERMSKLDCDLILKSSYYENLANGRRNMSEENKTKKDLKISNTIKSAWESGSYDSRICNFEGQKPWDNKGNKSVACKLTWAYADKIYKQHIKFPNAKQISLSNICNRKFDLENLYGSKVSTGSMGTVLKWFDDRGWDPKLDEDWLKFRKSFNKNHKSEVRARSIK